MILIPAIDLLDGRCVRLVHGDFNDVTGADGAAPRRETSLDVIVSRAPTVRAGILSGILPRSLS